MNGETHIDLDPDPEEVPHPQTELPQENGSAQDETKLEELQQAGLSS